MKQHKITSKHIHYKKKHFKLITTIDIFIPCQGQSKWDELIKNNKHASDMYERFISKITCTQLNSTQKKENKYIYTSCDTEI